MAEKLDGKTGWKKERKRAKKRHKMHNEKMMLYYIDYFSRPCKNARENRRSSIPWRVISGFLTKNKKVYNFAPILQRNHGKIRPEIHGRSTWKTGWIAAWRNCIDAGKSRETNENTWKAPNGGKSENSDTWQKTALEGLVGPLLDPKNSKMSDRRGYQAIACF